MLDVRIVVEAQAALAHQIRNPLTVAGLSVEQLLMTESGVEVRERLERVRSSLQAIEQQIRNALVFVRGELIERHTFTVSALVAAMRDAWSSLLDGHAVTWDEAILRPMNCVDGDLATLVGALTNIVDNADRRSAAPTSRCASSLRRRTARCAFRSSTTVRAWTLRCSSVRGSRSFRDGSAVPVWGWRSSMV